MSLMKIKDLFHFEKGSLQSTKATPGEYDFITAAADWKTHNEFTHDCEALIFAAAASGSLGRTHYVYGKFISSDLCFIITPKDPEKYPIDIKFYHLIFLAFKDEIVRNTKSGTSKEAIGLTVFGKYEIPYFEIEKQIETRDKFVNAQEATNELNSELTSQINIVEQLRQAFLTDAMQGKLMSMAKSDEPATLLLGKIKAEKERLTREKKIKKQKPLQLITPDEIPFEIPENWSWCRLGELLLDIKYGTSKSCDYNSNRNSRVLRIPNVSGHSLNGDDLKFTDLSEKEQKDLALEQDDILIIRSNGSRELVGKTVLVNGEFVGFAYAGYLVRLRFNINLINARFLLRATKSNFFRDLIEKPLRTTVGINNINTQEISNLLVPIPPLEIQILLADKLDELMLFLDSLNKNISESIINNELLLKQVLTEALGIEILKEKPQKETSKKDRQRTSKYDPNTILMEIVPLLKKHGKLHAEELWKMSKYYGPKEEDRKIDEFYAELKKQIEMNKTVKESSEKGYLELV